MEISILFIFGLLVTQTEGEPNKREKHDRLIIRLVTWINNPPYYIKNNANFSLDHKGLLISMLENAGKICQDFTKHVTVIDENHLDTHSQMLELLQHNDTTKALHHHANITAAEHANEVIIVSAMTILEKHKINSDFLMAQILISQGLAVVVHVKDILLLRKFLDGITKCFIIIYFSIVICIIVATLVWIFEHNFNKRFPKTYGKGLWVSFWFCFVTMTTVGYGEKVPKHFVTRFICICWMIFGLMLTAMITATVIREINTEVKTTGEYIAVLNNSAEMELIPYQLKGKPKPYNSYEEILDAVNKNDVKAALIDENTAAYLFNKSFIAELRIERRLKVTTPVYMFIKTPTTTPHHAAMIQHCFISAQKEILATVKSRYIPPMDISAYHIETMSEIFQKKDGGVVQYSTAIACCLVLLAITVELKQVWLNHLNNKKSELLTVETEVIIPTEEERNYSYDKSHSQLINELRKEILKIKVAVETIQEKILEKNNGNVDLVETML